MTPAERIREAVEDLWGPGDVPPTIADVSAAVCEALADQVVPHEPAPPPDPPTYEMIENPMDSIEYVTAILQRQETRRQILAIARELRGEVAQ